MPFKPLLELRVEHPFYASGAALGASVAAEPATSARLAGLRLLQRSSPGRLAIVGDFTDAGDPVVALPETVLRFTLELEPALLSATDRSGLPPGTVFTDAGAGKPMKAIVRETRSSEVLQKPDGTATFALAGRPRAAAKAGDFKVVGPASITLKAYDPEGNRVTLAGPAADVGIDYPVAAPGGGPLAAVEVPVAPATGAAAAAGKPALFQILLEAVTAPWCYHLVTDLPNPLAEWRITHPAGDGPAADFGAGGVAEVAAADPADPYGSALLGSAAPLRVLRFVSDSPVVCSEARARRIALFAGDRQLFSALPNPAPSAVRLLNGKPAFGETLRFVTA